MKKKLFALLLAVTLLLGMLPTAALAADSAAPDATPVAAVTAAPEVTEAPAETEQPSAAEEPDVTATPSVTEEPETTATPSVTEEPETTAAPSVTEEPETTATPPATEESTGDEPEAEEESAGPLRAPAAEQKVRVIVQNNTFPVSKGAPWDGVLVDTWVEIDENSTMMSCVAAALEAKGYESVGTDGTYIQSINGLAALDGGDMSGWMGTLNDFFVNASFAEFTVANGKLVSGDEICVSYTSNGYGEDIGGSWSNTDTRLKTLTFSAGTLSPEFDSDTFEYTLTVPADTESVVVTPTAANKNYQVRTYKNTATPEEDGTEYKRTAAIPVEDGAKLIVMCGHDSWPTMNSTSDGVKTYTVTVKMETEQPVSTTVRVTFSAQKDGEYLVKPTAFTVQDGTAELYGFSVPAADHAGVAIETPVFLDLLVAAHAAKYGDAFTKDTAGNYLTVASSGMISKAFGQSATSSSFVFNGQMPADDGGTGYHGGEARLTDGDSVDYFFYQSDMWTDYYTAFTETEKTVYTGDEFTLTLEGYMLMMGMSGSGMVHVDPQPIDGTNEDTAIAFYLLNEDGSLGDALDATLNAKGEVTFKFDKAGTYTITANGFVYDETMDDSCPIVAPSCTVTVRDANVTVNVTISKAGAIAEDKDGNLVAHRALTVAGKTVTINDVLIAAHKAWHPDGAAAYVTESTIYGLQINKLWGDETTALAYYVNDAMAADLNEAVSEGDSITAYTYEDKDNYSDAHGFFDVSTAEIETGESVTLTFKKDGYLPPKYDFVTEPVANAVITVDGEDTANTTDAKGVVTVKFDKAGTYVVSAHTQDGSIVSPPVCVVTVTDPTIIVNVTISKAGAIAEDKDGNLVAHRALTVVGKTVTINDVLIAAHKAWHPDGAAAYVTESTEYGLLIKKLWGDETTALAYYVNDAMAFDLNAAVSEGDSISAYTYADKENYSDAHGFFDVSTVEAKTGEAVSLTFKKDGYLPPKYDFVTEPVANAVITVDGEDTANITNSKGVVTLVFNAAGTYVVSARTQDGSIVSPPVCVVTVTGDTQGDGGISGSGDPYARLTGLLVHTSFNPNSSNVLLRNAADTSYANDVAVVFDPDVTEYTLAALSDTGNMQLRFRPKATSGAKVTLAYGDGETKDITWTSGSSKFANCIAPGKNTLTLTVSATGKESTVYTLSIDVTPTLSDLIAEGDGVAYSFDKTFSAAKSEYTLTVPDSLKTLKLTATPKNDTYTVTYNGAESSEIDISDAALTEITVAVSVDGVKSEYVLKLSRIKAGNAAFNITPEECADAVITVKDASGQIIAPEEDGSYAGLFDTYTYTYTVSKYGYVVVAGTIPAEGGVIDVALVKNAENQFDDVSSDWNNFRNSDTNMGLTDAKTPTDAESSALLWSKKLGSGWSAAPSVQIIVDDGLIVMTGTTLYKLDLATGEIIGEGTMVGSPSYGYTPPTYAAGLIFCPLGSGTIQAFNAKTLESVWVYKDPLGGQSLTPIAYSDGYIYTGFWNAETKEANFVAVSVSDDDPASATEAKYATWSVTRMGGYYWAGAVIVGDTLIVGGDDGTSGFEGDSSISSFNKRTGALISSLTLTGMGDQRSSIAYDAATGRVYFTTKNGYLCSAALDAATGVLSDLKSAGSNKQSTTTPIVYKGRAYYALGAGFSDPGDFVVADAATMQEIGRVSLKGYPQCSPLLSTAYEDQGWLYFYSTYNTMPGGITLIKVKTDAASSADMEVVELYDAKGFEQYCISSLICDKNGTLYYKNDSGNVFAFGTPTYGSVIRQIRAIGEVTEDSYLAIEAARNAYNALTPEDQAKVTNEPDLTAAENAYAKLIEEKIDAIGTVTLEKEEQIKKTAELFDQMNETMQGKVSNSDKLKLALKTLSDLKVSKAEDLIEEIPTNVTNANKKETQEKLKEAKKYLESLTEDEQAKVTNKNRIDLAEAAIKKLAASGGTKGLKLLGGKKQSESVNAIVEAIRALLNPADPADKLPEDMADRTETQEDAILDIARAYNELSDDNKLFVTNYGDFEPVLEKLGAAYHADKETGVSVDGLPWHIRLVCVPLEEGSELLEAMNPVFSGKGSAKSMYWVTLIDVLTGKTYKTEEPFTVRLPLDETPGEDETALAMYVSEDGKLRFLQGKDEEETADETEKTLAFETTETSCWYGAASIDGTWDDLMNGKILMEAGDELTNWLHWLAVTVKLVRTIVK